MVRRYGVSCILLFTKEPRVWATANLQAERMCFVMASTAMLRPSGQWPFASGSPVACGYGPGEARMAGRVEELLSNYAWCVGGDLFASSAESSGDSYGFYYR